MTTAVGKAMAGLLSVFAEFERDLLRERVKAGIAHARKKGKPHGRPRTAARKAEKVRKLYKIYRGSGRILHESLPYPHLFI